MTKICISSESVEARDTKIATLTRALQEIAMMHPGDQPASSALSEEQWLRKHVVEMRVRATDALNTLTS